MLLVDTLKKATKHFAKKQAIRCQGEQWTYGAFDDRSARLARFLEGLGIRPSDRVAILHRNCHCFLEAYYGIARLGAVSVPINTRLAPKDVAFIIRDSGARALIAEPLFGSAVDSIRGEVPILEKILWTGDEKWAHGPLDVGYEDALLRMAVSPLGDLSISEEDLAQIYYTSGTTGRPKGVMLTHKNVMVHALAAIAEFHLTDRDVWAHVAPLFHLADAWATWAITWVGGTHIIVPEFEATMVLETIDREKVTLTNLIPTMLNHLVNHPDVSLGDYSSLRVLLSGGAPIAPKVVNKIVEIFGCDYIQTYGMTETSPYLTVSILKDHLKRLPTAERLRFQAKTGREFLGVELKVVNDRGEVIKPDEKEVGEILARGDIVTRGYWGLPEETEKAIKDGWLHTGDLAVIDEEGYITIVDRKKDMILTGGENVYSTEVEHVLYEHPAVLECAVVGIPDEEWGEAVKGIVRLKPDQQTSEQELILFCRERLARFKAPRSIDFSEALPKTGSGKICKRVLRDAYWKGYDKKVH